MPRTRCRPHNAHAYKQIARGGRRKVQWWWGGGGAGIEKDVSIRLTPRTIFANAMPQSFAATAVRMRTVPGGPYVPDAFVTTATLMRVHLSVGFAWPCVWWNKNSNRISKWAETLTSNGSSARCLSDFCFTFARIAAQFRLRVAAALPFPHLGSTPRPDFVRHPPVRRVAASRHTFRVSGDAASHALG